MSRTRVRELQPNDELSGLQKAAVLLVALDQTTAARIMKRLPREQVEEISRAIASIGRVAPEVRRKTITEFHNLLLAHQYMNVGGPGLARSLLQKTLPADEARGMIDVLEQHVCAQPFGFLQKAETENLLTFLQGEHPQTIALVLSHLPAATASEVLAGLESTRQAEVVVRIARMDQTSPDVIKEVERGLEKRLAGVVSERFERTGGVKAVAEMLNLAGRETERTIMDSLEEDHAELVDEIRRLMFVFEDILRVDDRGIQAVLKEIENEELALSLRTASDELKSKIFSNMSERAAQLIKEEMEYMGPVRISDVENAQQKIVDTVRRLEDAGEIIISGKGGDKDLIV
jgi:flagellar motor switch protein FliG